MTTLTIAANEILSDRPFTRPEATARDLRHMVTMLNHVRRMVVGFNPDFRVPAPWRTEHRQPDGRIHKLVICDLPPLRMHQELSVVGFFGQARAGRNLAGLLEVNDSLVEEFRNYPGILTYSTLQLGRRGNFGNLILHDRPETRELWRSSARHVQAATELSPAAYHSVRIHNGFLPQGLLNRWRPVITVTKYWDFDDGWQWIRVFGYPSELAPAPAAV